jgi:hypothetical protein
MLIGDSKFKGVELYLSENRILILKIITFESQMPIALDVISDKYAITSGINACFGGSYTIKFTESEKYEIIDFAGITFRKEKTK